MFPVNGESSHGLGAWNRLSGFGQPAATLNGDASDSGSIGGGNSLTNSDAATNLTSGGGNAPIYSSGDGGSSDDTGDVLGNLSQTVSDDWPWILGAVAVAGALGIAFYVKRKGGR
jgi:hypothetical protein